MTPSAPPKTTTTTVTTTGTTTAITTTTTTTTISRSTATTSTPTLKPRQPWHDEKMDLLLCCTGSCAFAVASYITWPSTTITLHHHALLRGRFKYVVRARMYQEDTRNTAEAASGE